MTLDLSKPTYSKGHPVTFHAETADGQLVFKNKRSYSVVDRDGRKNGVILVSNERRTSDWKPQERPVGMECFVLLGKTFKRGTFEERVKNSYRVKIDGKVIRMAAAYLFTREQFAELIAGATALYMEEP